MRGSTHSFGPIPPLSEPKTGQSITAIGYPLTAALGEDPRVVTGVVSALKGVQADATRAQITAPVQPGNSGGPVFNEQGAVVGVTVAKLKDIASPDGDVENVNFMVKSSYIRALVKQAGVEPGSESPDAALLSPEGIFDRFESVVQPVRVTR